MTTMTAQQIARLTLIVIRECGQTAGEWFLASLAEGKSVSGALMPFASGWDARGLPRATAAEMIAEARTA